MGALAAVAMTIATTSASAFYFFCFVIHNAYNKSGSKFKYLKNGSNGSSDSSSLLANG